MSIYEILESKNVFILTLLDINSKERKNPYF